MIRTSEQARAIVHVRWRRASADERRAQLRWVRERKRLAHLHAALKLNGHYCFMNICQRYSAHLRRRLTPAERAWIRVRHAEEIAASVPKDSASLTADSKHKA